MTEKRFTVETSENQLIIVDNEGPDDYYHLGCDERDVKGICKMLNDLNKDNQEEIQAFKKQNKELTQLIKTLIKENEELKQENMEYYHLVNCRNCIYHNYDGYVDGEEYEVCDKGNNERLMYNQFCKEWEKK